MATVKSNTIGVVLFSVNIFVLLLSCSHGAVVVSKDGSGGYTSIAEAIAKAPSSSKKPYTIHIRAGIYNEYVTIPREKTNIWLIGEGSDNTKIIGKRSAYGSNNQIDESATVAIYGSGFVAQNIAFVNEGGRKAGPAVAVQNQADKSAFYKCSFEGYQDTLWAVSGLQLYKDCRIYGTVDFVMGNAAAVFQNCILYARYDTFINFAAQSRENPNDPTGFVFQKCNFTWSPESPSGKSRGIKATLGRPWRNYSRVVILESYLDSTVDPKGWRNMHGRPTDKVTFLEYRNEGPGSKAAGRVKWANVVTSVEGVKGFTVSKFIKGDSWIPQTRIPYNGGL